MTQVLKREMRAVDGLSNMGDPWSFLILREALFRVQRFDELRRNIGCARSILADRLARMVAAGILTRKTSVGGEHRPIYKLTRAGVDTFQLVVALVQWGDRWLAGRAGPPLLFTHNPCGKRLKGELRCASCGEAVTLRNISSAPRQSGRQALLKRTRRASNSQDYLRGRKCSGARTMRIVGNRWTLMILLEILGGASRFEEIRESLAIARNILADRLSNLVDEQILARQTYQSAPIRREYKLTARGKDLLAACLLLRQWSDTWYGGAGQVGPGFVHTTCGKPLVPVYACVSCSKEISAFDVSYEDGPGAGMNDANQKIRTLERLDQAVK